VSGNEAVQVWMRSGPRGAWQRVGDVHPTMRQARQAARWIARQHRGADVCCLPRNERPA
jgi:hypothetical protein